MNEDGMIEVDSPFGREVGFTSDRFAGDSYLWRDGGEILVSFVAARHPGQGAFSALVKAIEARGLTVAVPTPLGRMQAILTRWGFHPIMVDDPDMGGVEVWKRCPSSR